MILPTPGLRSPRRLHAECDECTPQRMAAERLAPAVGSGGRQPPNVTERSLAMRSVMTRREALGGTSTCLDLQSFDLEISLHEIVVHIN